MLHAHKHKNSHHMKTLSNNCIAPRFIICHEIPNIFIYKLYMDGLMQNICNSRKLAMELYPFCIEPLICQLIITHKSIWTIWWWSFSIMLIWVVICTHVNIDAAILVPLLMIFNSSHCNSLACHYIGSPILKRKWLDHMRGYQESSPSGGCQVICPVVTIHLFQ